MLCLSLISALSHSVLVFTFRYISVWLPPPLIRLYSFILLELFSFSHFAVKACQICSSTGDDRLPVLQGMPFPWWFMLITVLTVSLQRRTSLYKLCSGIRKCLKWFWKWQKKKIKRNWIITGYQNDCSPFIYFAAEGCHIHWYIQSCSEMLFKSPQSVWCSVLWPWWILTQGFSITCLCLFLL